MALAEPAHPQPEEARPRQVWKLELPSEAFRWWHDKYVTILHHEEDVLGSYVGAFYVAQAALLAAVFAVLASALDYSVRMSAFSLVALLGAALSTTLWAVAARTSPAIEYWKGQLEVVETADGRPAVTYYGPNVKGGKGEITQPYRGFDQVFQETLLRGEQRSALLSPSRNPARVTAIAVIAWCAAAVILTALSILSEFGVVAK